jgi:hypothetical protein
MRFRKDIVQQIDGELRKVPSIRHACKKVNLHPSTFYRWLSVHPEFHKTVVAALMFGRENMCDAAESVIIQGVQRGDQSAAKYYLSHNEIRYMDHKTRDIHEDLTAGFIQFSEEDVSKRSVFTRLSKLYYSIDGKKKNARKIMNNFLDAEFLGDRDLRNIFYLHYKGWKVFHEVQVEKEKMLKKAQEKWDNEEYPNIEEEPST